MKPQTRKRQPPKAKGIGQSTVNRANETAKWRQVLTRLLNDDANRSARAADRPVTLPKVNMKVVDW